MLRIPPAGARMPARSSLPRHQLRLSTGSPACRRPGHYAHSGGPRHQGYRED
jgi:hypothetical protein